MIRITQVHPNESSNSENASSSPHDASSLISPSPDSTSHTQDFHSDEIQHNSSSHAIDSSSSNAAISSEPTSDAFHLKPSMIKGKQGSHSHRWQHAQKSTRDLTQQTLEEGNDADIESDAMSCSPSAASAFSSSPSTNKDRTSSSYNHRSWLRFYRPDNVHFRFYILALATLVPLVVM